MGDLFSLTHAAVTHLAATLDGLDVDTDRMSANAATIIDGSPTGEDHREASCALVDRLLSDYEQDRTSR